jgi:type IX secretion system PorP/SprF family membrane protein
MKERYAGALLLSGFLGSATAQDAQFTQFYAAPTYVSPAFAGTTAGTRFALQYRDQWPSIPGAFVTFNLAVDHYISELNSGIGFIAQHDRAGTGGLRYSTVGVQYAYEIQLKRKVFLRPALQFCYVNHSVDYSRLLFGDQLARGGDVGSFENFNGRTVKYTDISGGLLYFTPKLWLGVGFHHLNQPNQSLLLRESMVPMRISVHGGRRFKMVTPVIKKHQVSIVAAFNYRMQAKYDQLDIGGYFERDPIFAGIWFRGIPLLKAYQAGYQNNDALALVVGTKVNDWRFGYSYDITLSRLAANSGGAHEITMAEAEEHGETPCSAVREVLIALHCTSSWY